jgi:hypothetical protein
LGGASVGRLLDQLVEVHDGTPPLRASPIERAWV